MKVTILIRGWAAGGASDADEATVERVYAQHRAFEAAVTSRGTLIAGAALAPSGTTLEATTRTATDGPFTESVEHISGLYIVDVDSRDVAVELARLLPEEYALEIRDPMVLEGY